MTDSRKRRAVVMFSGGLDSTLAARITADAGAGVVLLHFRNVFHAGASHAAQAAEALTMSLVTRSNDSELLELVSMQKPPHGFGRNMNPCVACRIRMLIRARKMMEELEADFVVTGEVVGQRPLSQTMDKMRIAERESGLEGFLLRPLSAKLLPETEPERRGWVDREKLLDIRGRSRRTQLELAAAYGLKGFSSPAGGCLLTDKSFSDRLRNLLQLARRPSVNDIELLKCGRHFRVGADALAVVGRNKEDNERIEALAADGDILLDAEGGHSPTTLLRRFRTAAAGREEPQPCDPVEAAARLTANYSKERTHESVCILWRLKDASDSGKLLVEPGIAENVLEGWRVGGAQSAGV